MFMTDDTAPSPIDPASKIGTEKPAFSSINIPNLITRTTLKTIESGEELEETSLNRLIQDWGNAVV
jgi:hypothetical protein